MSSINLGFWWLFLNLISTITLAFYSMEEMACVSFNKIRLQYYVSKGMKRAIWLNFLLQNPVRLFGTTLIAVNAAMFIGSECARQSFLAFGLNPDYSVIPQIVFVLLLGELAPMFAARRYAEHVALLGAPILYISAKALTPLLWTVTLITDFIDWITGSKSSSHRHTVLNRDDLQKILDFQKEDHFENEEEEAVETVSQNIFSLRYRNAEQVMLPIQKVVSLPSNTTVKELRELLKSIDLNFIPIHHRGITHILGIIHPRDLVRIPDNRHVSDYAASPWFITQHTKLIQILKDFRRNNKSVAVVLNEQGLAMGIVTLEMLTEELFGKMGESNVDEAVPPLVIDRTFPAELRVEEFNQQFDVELSDETNLTLGELMEKLLGHHPEAGETVFLPPFELTVKETTLTEIKTIEIHTRL